MLTFGFYAADSNESWDDEFLADSPLLVSCSPKAFISSSKRSRKSFARDHVNVQESGEVLDDDVKVNIFTCLGTYPSIR